METDERKEERTHLLTFFLGRNIPFQVNVMKILCEQKTVIIDADYFSYINLIDSDCYFNFYLITLVSIFIQQLKVDLLSVM